MIEPGGEAFDSVYFFMWPGWSRELRSNRWHYARRWARRKPVVLIQPDRLLGLAGVRRETRFEGAHVLSIAAASPEQGPLAAGILQTAQIARYMLAAGHERPLFWIYNPYLLAPVAGLPSVCCVLHATENYFDFDPARAPAGLLPLLRTTARLCDLVVAVSSGVAEGMRREVPEARIEVVTNGCDFSEYAAGRPSARLRRAAAGFDRVAIYAGNLNYRLDFDLLQRCVEREPGTFFAVFGPVGALSDDDRARWAALRRTRNFHHFGPVDAAEIPDLYAAADLGLIPYRRLPLVEKNGFPLKALEMAATGLPVVSTYMEPLEAVADALSLERDPEAFLARVRERSRARLTEAESGRIREVARSHDYDRKFEAVLSLARSACHEPSARLDRLVVDGWGGEWTRAAAEAVPSTRMVLKRTRALLLPRILGPVGRALPAWAVRGLRRSLLGRRVLSAAGRQLG